MRIQSEYMSFNNRCTISSSYDFQVQLQHSRRTCSIPIKMVFTDCSTVIRGAPKLDAGSPRLDVGTA